MGYDVYYNLEIHQDKDDNILDDDKMSKIILELQKESEAAEFAFDDFGNTENPIRRWEEAEDLQPFSKKYPDKLFKLYCQGEDDERWILYVKDGKSQICGSTLTYADYDPERMTE